jgi:hypothetical protein
VDERKLDPVRSRAYFELRDAFREEGCPICRLLLKWTRAYLDSLLYEYVNDPGVRLQLSRSQGFCNWHAWMTTTIANSPSGIAIIYEHLLSDQIGTLEGQLELSRPTSWWTQLRTKSLRRPRGARTPDRGGRGASCPACGRRDEFLERELIRETLDSLSDGAFADDFRASFGLCLPHLDRATTMGQGHPNLPMLLGCQLEKLRMLCAELREHIRLLDYRFTAEPRGGEQTAWRRAIELFVGKPEVFGPDRHVAQSSRRDHPVRDLAPDLRSESVQSSGGRGRGERAEGSCGGPPPEPEPVRGKP